MKGTKRRILQDRIFQGTVLFFAMIALAPLFLILFTILRKGISSLNLTFLTTLPAPPGEEGGGIVNALAGTGIMVALATAFSLPPAVLAGIYLAEERERPLAKMVRGGLEILQGVPSIVVGILIYLWVVRVTGFFSALSGALALAMMMLPVITKSVEETLLLIPHSLKEASLALGVSYSRTIFKVLLPAGMAGILNGILLGVARVAGETAPLLFTAFGSPFMNLNPLKPMSSLPLIIFNYASSPYPQWHDLAWGASLILIFLVFVLNVLARLGAKKWRVKF